MHEFLGQSSCSTSEHLGGAIADAVDFDGDGVPDIVIGSVVWSDPTDCLPWGGGKAAVYSGATWQVLFEGIGAASHDYFGVGAKGLGDVNGDGFADIGAAAEVGYVRIYLGPSGALLREHSGSSLRPSISGVGDEDADGADDYAIGWMQDSTNGTYTGKVVVYSGATGAPIPQGLRRQRVGQRIQRRSPQALGGGSRRHQRRRDPRLCGRCTRRVQRGVGSCTRISSRLLRGGWIHPLSHRWRSG
jgi:hypothetical protein